MDRVDNILTDKKLIVRYPGSKRHYVFRNVWTVASKFDMCPKQIFDAIAGKHPVSPLGIQIRWQDDIK